ncbi:hypothetical protein FOZ60_015195 [Perkinsus olseni]|uniref:Uncharacterized protein n=1 Tax=Perkinsus olseni TaxID=32597 RepID=A0A7J6P690_PEROL|nr:hypothetical protein FOZ60_015195 [Perkinsus olseni]
MTTIIFLIALASGVVGSIFDGYTLPGDEQYWRLRGNSTVPVTSSTTSTTTTAPTESALDQLLNSLVIPEYRHVPSTAEPLSIEEQLQRLEIPYHGIPTKAPTTTTPAPPATTSKFRSDDRCRDECSSSCGQPSGWRADKLQRGGVGQLVCSDGDDGDVGMRATGRGTAGKTTRLPASILLLINYE